MSHKRYQYKLIEAAEATELETLLREAGARMWAAVGYGVLPDGRRSVLLERKVKVRSHHRERPQGDYAEARRSTADERTAAKIGDE